MWANRLKNCYSPCRPLVNFAPKCYAGPDEQLVSFKFFVFMSGLLHQFAIWFAMTSVFIMKYLSVFTDGGSRGNPGTAAFGVVIRDKEAILHAFGQTIGIATNNIAEYSGILEALAWIYGNREAIGEISGIDVYMDSQLAYRQLTGTYRIKKPHLAEFLTKIREVEKKLSIPIHYHHIPRERNKEADRMVNEALDNS